MTDTKRRHLLETEELRRFQATVTREDLAVFIHEDWIVKAEGLDTIGNLPDLLA
jgi:hypothetical protein